MFGLGMFSGNFVSGMMEERDRLSGERLRVARAFDEFKRNNPYATMEEFRSFADQVSGGDSYLRGRFPTDEVLQRLADDNQQRRAMDDAQRQAQVLNTELQVDEALQRTLRRNVLASGDPMRAIEETVNAFARDPASREQLRGRVMSSVGDPSAFFTRVQFEESERVMPSVLNALRQGIDITPFVQGLPDSVRTQVQGRAREIVERERAEQGRIRQDQDRRARIDFEDRTLPLLVDLASDPNNREQATSIIRQRAEMLGVRLSPGDEDRLLATARGMRDGALVRSYGQAVEAGRQAGAARADQDINTYQNGWREEGDRRFPNRGDIRPTVIREITNTYFVPPELRSAANAWLDESRNTSGRDAAQIRGALEQFLASRSPGGRLITLADYRVARAADQAGTTALPPVQFAPWRENTDRDLNRLRDATRAEVERRVQAGDRAGAQDVLREAQAELSRIESDVVRRRAQPGWFQTAQGPYNRDQVEALATSAAEIRRQLAALLPPDPQAPRQDEGGRGGGSPAPRPAASPQPGQVPRAPEERAALASSLRALPPAQQAAAREAAARAGGPISQAIIDRVRQMPEDEVKMMHALNLVRAASGTLTLDARIRAAARQAGVDEAALREALSR